MSPRPGDLPSDGDFEAFLQGRGELAQSLRQLTQPTPSAALDAAILAQAQADLRQPTPANEPFIVDRQRGSRLGHFLRRARLPLAAAASVLVAVLVGVQWQSQSQRQQTTVLAQAPLTAPTPPPAPEVHATPPADAQPLRPKAASTRAQPSAPVTVTPPPRISIVAQADIPEPAGGTLAESGSETRSRAMPAAAPAAAAPAAAAPAPAVEADDVKATQWLKFIDELMKAQLQGEAQAEWEKFRAQYPAYPVPEKLAARLKALKK